MHLWRSITLPGRILVESLASLSMWVVTHPPLSILFRCTQKNIRCWAANFPLTLQTNEVLNSHYAKCYEIILRQRRVSGVCWNFLCSVLLLPMFACQNVGKAKKGMVRPLFSAFFESRHPLEFCTISSAHQEVRQSLCTF